MKPYLSVIMSVYNGETYLEEAIRSVMGQTFTNWELIVINDCSTDSTAEILSRLAAEDGRIKVHPNEVNLRLPTSLNRAISLSEGRYIARMDADDICLPNRFERQFAFMESHPDLALSSCRFMTMKNGVFQSGGAGARCDSDALCAMLLVGNPILHPGVIAKAEVLRALQYDTKLTCTEDLELWTRFAMEGHKMAILPECLLLYRLHDKQITATTRERQYTEVRGIEETYYRAMGQAPDEKMLDYYIRGVYFTENVDPQSFLRYAKWLKSTMAKKFGRNAVNYALFEALAEQKRHGLRKADLLRILFSFPPVFAINEMCRRKRAAKAEISDCRRIAVTLGLVQTGGDAEFPIFERKADEAVCG